MIKRIKKNYPLMYKKSLSVSNPFFILHKNIFDKGEEILKDRFHLSQSELDVLASIIFLSEDNSTITPTQLYEIMIFTSGGMTKLLKKLEDKGYIQRVESSEDKRSKLVQITSLGEKIATEALGEIIEFEDKYFSKLDKKEQKLFQELLYKILE